MIIKTESQTLADVYADVRKMTKFYFSKIKDTDIGKRFEINGEKFNSAHWLMAHLVWTEDGLLIKSLTGESSGIPWVNSVKLGSNPDNAELPPIDEIMAALDATHIKALENIRALSNENLEEKTHTGLVFGGADTKRNIIHHAIRHEPMHIGHLGWIAKMSGIKII